MDEKVFDEVDDEYGYDGDYAESGYAAANKLLS